MTVRQVTFRCGKCGLGFEATVGSTPANQGLYRAFWCPEEGQVVTVNVNEPSFGGRCPTCAAQMTLLADFPLDACPRCHAPTGVDKSPDPTLLARRQAPATTRP